MPPKINSFTAARNSPDYRFLFSLFISREIFFYHRLIEEWASLMANKSRRFKLWKGEVRNHLFTYFSDSFFLSLIHRFVSNHRVSMRHKTAAKQVDELLFRSLVCLFLFTVESTSLAYCEMSYRFFWTSLKRFSSPYSLLCLTNARKKLFTMQLSFVIYQYFV